MKLNLIFAVLTMFSASTLAAPVGGSNEGGSSKPPRLSPDGKPPYELDTTNLGNFGCCHAIPVVSQGIACCNAIAENQEEAKASQEYFARTACYPCHMAHDAVKGNHDSMKETNRVCVDCMDDAANVIPVVAHVKALVHAVRGDKDAALYAVRKGTIWLVAIPAALWAILLIPVYANLTPLQPSCADLPGICYVYLAEKVDANVFGVKRTHGKAFKAKLSTFILKAEKRAQMLVKAGADKQEAMEMAADEFCDDVEVLGISCGDRYEFHREIRKRARMYL